ncbi:MAG TPA: Ldh family oxidoreductase [Acetobacteraceae bacterium]|jgi:(2R)-3-sulfolactate dehydrogenase (NADP+)|nr:Ldh family oxidoreductase [Acetobacteraceae bacterium]
MTEERLTVAAIENLAEAALVAHGARAESAAALARAIAAAERDGMPAHGLAYLPTYCLHLDCGKVAGAAVPSLAETAPGVLVADAASGFAHPAIALGLAALPPLARAQGVAALAVRNSYNCGVLGYHTEQIAASGLVGIGFTNAPASIAPWGALKPVLGTNPWSLAVPGADGAAFVIDQSASVVAKSEVMKRARAGEALPTGWALDAEGKPTTDADAALKGTMMPSGGPKGVNAALLVEVMAACLAGAVPGVQASPFSGPAGGPPRTGQFFLAFDPNPSSGGLFADRLATVIEAFAAGPGSRLPGARRRAARARADHDGVAVDSALLAQLRALVP